MTPSFVTGAERPDLWEAAQGLTDDVWPEYNRHGDVLNLFWPRLYAEFPEFQFLLLEGDEPLAEGHTMPCVWSEDIEGLPAGIDEAVEQGFRLRGENGTPTTLCALAIEIPPSNQSRGLSRTMIEAMAEIGRAHGFGDLIAPVRPSWKDRYPLAPIERYVRWTREDELPFDPWIRVHHRLGGDVLLPVADSLRITGTVAEWEEWTEMAFPETGTYVFPRGLAPVEIDREADRGAYWEPNVWMRHRIPPRSSGVNE